MYFIGIILKALCIIGGGGGAHANSEMAFCFVFYMLLYK